MNQAYFPAERSSWTAAAMILAADALSRTTPGAALFRDLPGAPATARAGDGAGPCGCPAAAQPPG